MAGFFIHLAIGQGFALGYAAAFALLGRATWWNGALLGLPTRRSPRRASSRSCREPIPAWHRRAPVPPAPPLEPPGLFALNYGLQTPLVASPRTWSTDAPRPAPHGRLR